MTVHTAAAVSMRDRIIHQAATMFHERGYLGTTMRDLAKELGITSGSIFHHFGTKEEVLLAVVQRGVEHGAESIARAEALDVNPRDKVRAMVSAHLHSLLEGGPETLIDIFHEQWSLSQQTIDRMVEMRDQYEKPWDGAIEALGGEFSDPARRRLVRLLLLGALNWSAQWYRPGGPFEIDTIADEIMRLYFPHAS